MSSSSGNISLLTLILTSFVSVVITLGVVAIVISQYGVEKVATEVSPFVENVKNRVTEGVIPPSQRVEPETEADVIMDSVAQNQGSSVLIYGSSAAGEEFLGRGILVTSNGFLVTDGSLLKATNNYSVAVPGTKERFEATLIKTEDDLAVLKITISTTLVANFGTNFPATNDLVVAISGDTKMSIGTGIVTDMTNESIVTNIYGTMTPGSPLIAKSGNVIGISIIGEQRAGEAIFKTLTKDYISSLTTIVDRDSGTDVLN